MMARLPSYVLFPLALIAVVFHDIDAFSSFPPIIRHSTSTFGTQEVLSRFAKPDDTEEDDEDWRAFRAKLVMSEKGMTSSTSEAAPGLDEDDLDGFGALFAEKSSNEKISEPNFELPDGFTPLDPTQWAYDAGSIIEKGAVILGGAEQDFGFGLRQQYFHKAVILVLDHDEDTFTKGIILNRPSEKVMRDDDGGEWKVWFGGDVQGLDSILPDIVCLHSLRGEEAREVSETVLKDIQVRYDVSYVMYV